jgi:acyl carrier protein
MGFASVTMPDSGGSLITERVVNIVQGIFMKHSISRSVRPDDDLRELGLSSLALAELVPSVEVEFSLTIPDSEMVLENFRSVSAISKLISALLNADLLQRAQADVNGGFRMGRE